MTARPLPERVRAMLAEPGAPPLTLLTGPAGAGRSHLLRAVAQAARRAGRPVLQVRLAPEDRDEPWYLAGRVLAGLAPQPVRPAATRDFDVPAEPSGAALAHALGRRRGLVLLVDDVQWADPQSVAVLLDALHGPVGASVRCFAALRTGAPPVLGVAAGFQRLRAAGLARVAPVLPLSAADAEVVLRGAVQAVPHDSLSRPARRFSRGRPAALLAAVEGFRASGALRIADRRAYLTDTTAVVDIPAYQELATPVRALPAVTQSVARALAVLQPLGGAAPGLIAEALGMPVTEVVDHLGRLRREGIARRGGSGWRLPAPAVAVALRAALGPYERARLAQVAAEALWAGRACCADPAYLPDQVAAAGTLVDSAAALVLLRDRAAAAAVPAPADAARWWTAAAALSGDPADRAEALVCEAVAGMRAGRYGAARASLRRLLDGSVTGLAPATRQEAELLELACARGERDEDGVRSVAAGEPPVPGAPAPTPVTRAAAHTLLNRWGEAADLLPAVPAGTPVDGGAAAMVTGTVAAVTGRSAAGLPAEGEPDGGVGAGRRAAAYALAAYRMCLIVGDRAGADDPDEMILTATERALRDWRAGRWDAALDAAQFAMAADLAVGCHPAQAAVHRAAAETLLARGYPARARAVAEAARVDGAPLPHLPAVVLAEIEWALGNATTAARGAGDALAEAARHGVVLGTDELWLVVAERAMERGDTAAAQAAATSATAVAATLGTAASAARAAVARMIVGRDGTAADEAVARARDVGGPYELARTLERAVRWTGRTPGALGEAYELLGDLGAILHRSRLRQAMREYGLSVPGRAQTLAEGECLLARLVAEGLSNRHVAAATQSTEKSVEGRLTRLFTRTGYRSRVELAAAVLVADAGLG
jgi:DNA-binding CsgD family transcriptional regulator